MARSTILNEKMIDAFVEGAKTGHYIITICKRLGVSHVSYHGWVNKGKVDAANGKETIYSKFFKRVNEAKYFAIDKAIKSWTNQFDKDWRASAEYVARKEPNLWNKKETLNNDITESLNFEGTPIEKMKEVTKALQKGSITLDQYKILMDGIRLESDIIYNEEIAPLLDKDKDSVNVKLSGNLKVSEGEE